MYIIICGFMVHVVGVIKKWGNSLGMIIENKVTKKLDLKEGENIDVDILLKRRISGFGITKGAKAFKRELEEREF